MEHINIKEYFNQEMEKLRASEVKPSLTIIDATDGDTGNQIYIRKKMEDFQSLEWPVKVVKISEEQPPQALYWELNKIDTDCLIVQMPTAERFNFSTKDIPAHLDCDGLSPLAEVMPATVRGIIDYLDACGFKYEGGNAVVLGRSEIVGKPMAQALLDKNMTVSICHSKSNFVTRDRLLRDTDLVICATGQPHLITREQCPYAVVVDVGINRINGKLVGDFKENETNIHFGAWSTPVPGGVGLLTRLGLMKNCLDMVCS